MQRLDGKVALVVGGTRGAGRGIAVELGAAGATVYVTGRSVRGTPSPMGRAETIEETAELVNDAGGVGIAIRVDHTLPGSVQTLIDRIATEQDGQLDILVNTVWGGDELTNWDAPFWEHDLNDGLRMQQRGLHSHLITCHFAAPLLIARGGGVIIEMTDGVSAAYRGNLFYDLVKSSIIRLAVGMAEELRPHRVAAIAFSPGFLRSEAVLDHFGISEENWAVVDHPEWVQAGGRFSETPRFVGRAVTALVSDPDVLARSGTAISSGACAAHYGFTDLDGSQPDWDAAMGHWREHGAWPQAVPGRAPRGVG